MGTEYRLQNDTLATAQLLLATVPLFALLVYFLVETAFRSFEPPYSEAPGNDYKLPSIRLIDMLVSFMIVAFMWFMILIYMVFFIPRRHALVRRFLVEGFPVLGDVFFQGRALCGGFQHYGKVIYHHTNHDMYPVHLTRTVRVFERFTREKITILVLPEYAFSGHVKDDLEIDYLVITKTKEQQKFIKSFAMMWVVFTYLAPIYILYVMGKSPPEIDDEKQAWIIYLISTLVAIPILGFSIIAIAWARHFYWITKGDGKFYMESDNRGGAGWFENEDDCEMVNYEPPKPNQTMSEETSEYSEETSQYESMDDRRRGRGRKKSKSTRRDKTLIAISQSDASDLTGDMTASPSNDAPRRGFRRFF
jgi:hypothetical protein